MKNALPGLAACALIESAVDGGHFRPLRSLAGALQAVDSRTALATRASTGEYIDDVTITTRVKVTFVQDEQVSTLRINVKAFKGVVQLSGFANTEAERTRAAEIARSVPGVRDVKNDIRLRQASG